MKMESNDRRGTFRVQLQASVNLKVNGQIFATDTDIRDISLDGISINSTNQMPLNSICELEIIITGPSSVLQLTGKGRILRQDSHGIAVKFTELDMDSYMHLKNIVLYNRAPHNT